MDMDIYSSFQCMCLIFDRLNDCLELLEGMEEKGLLDMNKVTLSLYTEIFK